MEEHPVDNNAIPLFIGPCGCPSSAIARYASGFPTAFGSQVIHNGISFIKTNAKGSLFPRNAELNRYLTLSPAALYVLRFLAALAAWQSTRGSGCKSVAWWRFQGQKNGAIERWVGVVPVGGSAAAGDWVGRDREEEVTTLLLVESEREISEHSESAAYGPMLSQLIAGIQDRSGDATNVKNLGDIFESSRWPCNPTVYTWPDSYYRPFEVEGGRNSSVVLPAIALSGRPDGVALSPRDKMWLLTERFDATYGDPGILLCSIGSGNRPLLNTIPQEVREFVMEEVRSMRKLVSESVQWNFDKYEFVPNTGARLVSSEALEEPLTAYSLLRGVHDCILSDVFVTRRYPEWEVNRCINTLTAATVSGNRPKNPCSCPWAEVDEWMWEGCYSDLSIDWWALEIPEMGDMFLVMIKKFGASECLSGPKPVISLFCRVAESYRAVPFHNLCHVMQVTQMVGKLLDHAKTSSFGTTRSLCPLDTFALLFSAFAHDVDHPGVSAQCLKLIEHPTSLIYNSHSALENYHAYIATRIIRDEMTGVWEDSDLIAWTKTIIELVLSTDLDECHAPTLVRLSHWLSSGQSLQMERAELSMMKLMLMFADTSNVLLPFPNSAIFSSLMSKEFRNDTRVVNTRDPAVASDLGDFKYHYFQSKHHFTTTRTTSFFRGLIVERMARVLAPFCPAVHFLLLVHRDENIEIHRAAEAYLRAAMAEHEDRSEFEGGEEPKWEDEEGPSEEEGGSERGKLENRTKDSGLDLLNQYFSSSSNRFLAMPNFFGRTFWGTVCCATQMEVTLLNPDYRLENHGLSCVSFSPYHNEATHGMKSGGLFTEYQEMRRPCHDVGMARFVAKTNDDNGVISRDSGYWLRNFHLVRRRCEGLSLNLTKSYFTQKNCVRSLENHYELTLEFGSDTDRWKFLVRQDVWIRGVATASSLRAAKWYHSEGLALNTDKSLVPVIDLGAMWAFGALWTDWQDVSQATPLIQYWGSKLQSSTEGN